MPRVVTTNGTIGEFARDEHDFEVCTTREGDEQPARANILYADGDLALRRVATQTLTRTGYRVTAAENGFYAWEALHAGEYDLLITDTETPRLSGMELAAMARLEGMQLPIIVACGSFEFSSMPAHTKLGLAATLQKPFTPGDLIRIVGKVLCATLHARPGGDILLMAAVERFSHITPYRHWGINE
jgi:CheY-like chemotaxis protein